jgi:hypothetical protein
MAYVLARNEAANITECVQSLVAAGIPTTVLDSQSVDATRQLAQEAGAHVEDYRYTAHVEAYNQITRDRVPPGSVVFVLDADMIVSRELIAQAKELLLAGAQAVLAPVRMCWNGRRLRFASLYPPKPIAFRGGTAYFEPVGHGERLVQGTLTARTKVTVVNDDRKSFSAYLGAQERYARALIERSSKGAVSWRDRFRVWSPLFVVATPVISYFVRGGILDGRAGIGYALDRLIAEAIMYRQAIVARETHASSRAPC